MYTHLIDHVGDTLLGHLVSDEGFSPLSFSSLEFWLDGTDPNAFTLSGSTITAVQDKSQNAHAITVNGSPTYDSSEWNRGINLDGTDDYFTFGANGTLAFGIEQRTTVWVFESDEAEPDRLNPIIGTVDGNAFNRGFRDGEDDRSSFSYDERVSSYTYDASGTATVDYDDADEDIDTAKNNICSVQFGVEAGSNNDLKFKVDNVTVGAKDITGAVGSGNSSYIPHVGRLPGTGNYAKGKLSMLLVFSEKLSDADLDRVYDYVKQRITKKRKVVALIGQSDAQGTAANTNLPTTLQGAQAGEYIWNTTSGKWEVMNVGVNNLGFTTAQHGIEPQLLAKLKEDYGEDVFIFKYAVGGTSLHTDWDPSGGTQWTTTVTRWNAAKTELARMHLVEDVKAIIFDQGQSDADTEAHALAYGGLLDTFKTAARGLFGETLFIEPKLFVPDNTYPYWETVNAAKAAAAALDSNHHYIDEGVGTIDDVHRTSRSMGRVGYGIAEILTGVAVERVTDVATPFMDMDLEDQAMVLDAAGNIVDAASNEQIATITDKGSAGLSITCDSGARPVYNTGTAQMNFGTRIECGDPDDFNEFHTVGDITVFIVSDIVTEATSTLMSNNNGSFDEKGLSIFFFDDGPTNTYRMVGGTGSLFLLANNGSNDDYEVSGVEITALRVDDAAAADFRLYGNGALSISTNAANTGTGDADRSLHFASLGSESFYWSGFMQRSVIYKRTFTDAEMNTMGRALAKAHGGTWTDIT